ncbi:PotD/PotF family extracellular solute-binding protein [Streptomyces sp. NPDC020917]|uniref:PotD/PotF family extracellular solute-binding protein n=1 Tax=Streptomyces sp. NPDC020917 TaxID=3365102 RepID=UPI0037998D31
MEGSTTTPGTADAAAGGSPDRRGTGTPLTRRSLLAGGGAVAAGLFLAACASNKQPGSTGSSGGGKKLVITMTPFAGADLGLMPREFAKEYQDKHPNVQIKIDDTLIMTKQTAAYQADPHKPLNNLAFSNGGYTATGKSTGMYLKLDYSRIPNTQYLHPKFVEADHCGVVFGADQMGLVYNSKTYPQGFSSWADLWAPAQNGKLCFFSIPWWAIGMAAKLHGGGWDAMDPGFSLWAEHAKNIRTIVTANPQFLNVLSTSEAPLTSHYLGTSTAWRAQGAPIGYSRPDEGAFFDPVGININSGSSDDQLEVCYDIINEMLAPKWNQRWVDTSVEIPAVSTSRLTDKLKAIPAIAAGADQKFVDVDWATVGKSMTAWTERWNKDVVSKI